MNQTTDRTGASGSVAPIVAELQAALGTYPPTGGEIARTKARKADLDLRVMIRHADRRDRRLAELKEKARRTLRGEVDHE